MKRTFTTSLLAAVLLLSLVQHRSIATAVGFDGFDVSTETAKSDLTINTEADKSSESAAGEQKKSGNGFVRVISSPFRALGRLFGRGKNNDSQARRISEKEAAKFESAKVSRVKDASTPAPSESTAAATEPTLALRSEFDSHMQRGRELLLAGKIDGAIAELTAAASTNPKSAEVNKLLGIAYESKGLRERALQSFEVALHAEENNAEHLNNLGFLLYKNGDYDRAAKYLKRAAKLSPSDARIWNNLALTQCERGKFEDAYLSFVKAVGDFAGHMNVATQLQSKGYAQEAIKHVEKAQAIRPNSIDALQRLVALYDLTGRLTDAESARRSLVALKTFAEAK